MDACLIAVEAQVLRCGKQSCPSLENRLQDSSLLQSAQSQEQPDIAVLLDVVTNSKGASICSYR